MHQKDKPSILLVVEDLELLGCIVGHTMVLSTFVYNLIIERNGSSKMRSMDSSVRGGTGGVDSEARGVSGIGGACEVLLAFSLSTLSV